MLKAGALDLHEILDCFQNRKLNCLHCYEQHFRRRVAVHNHFDLVRIRIKGAQTKNRDFPDNCIFKKARLLDID